LSPGARSQLQQHRETPSLKEERKTAR
jgi:hypothetical protein